MVPVADTSVIMNARTKHQSTGIGLSDVVVHLVPAKSAADNKPSILRYFSPRCSLYRNVHHRFSVIVINAIRVEKVDRHSSSIAEVSALCKLICCSVLASFSRLLKIRVNFRTAIMTYYFFVIRYTMNNIVHVYYIIHGYTDR